MNSLSSFFLFSAMSLPAMGREVLFVESAEPSLSTTRFTSLFSSVSASFDAKGFEIQTKDGVCRLLFENVERGVSLEGEEQLPAKAHFFSGDPQRWRTQVPIYSKLRYRGLYPGIDLLVYSREGMPAYDLLLSEKADLSRVQIHCQGASSVSIQSDGTLLVQTKDGSIRQSAPLAWSVTPDGSRREVSCFFRKIGEDRYGFEAPFRDAEHSLHIDPLIYSSYFGGGGAEAHSDIAVDRHGMMYVTGKAWFNGAQDAFVVKLDPQGNGNADLVYAVFFGGSGEDGARAISVDELGQVFLTGWTRSTDFPTVNAYSISHEGIDTEAFVAKLSADGSNLLYSSYFGGDRNEEGLDIILDEMGRVVVGGFTESEAASFPLRGPMDSESSGFSEGFIAVFDLARSGEASLLYSSYIGGMFSDLVTGIDGKEGLLYLTGSTNSPYDPQQSGFSLNFPITESAFDVVCGANGEWIPQGNDAFLVVLDPQRGEDGLIYGSYLGGGCTENPINAQQHSVAPAWLPGVQVDRNGDIFLSGTTYSQDNSNCLFTPFPTTPECFKSVMHPEDKADAFLAVFRPVGELGQGAQDLKYSTYFGGSLPDIGNRIVVRDGKAYFCGMTLSFDFPVTPGAAQGAAGGSSDAFVAVLDPRLPGHTALIYSSYLGGSGSEEGADHLGGPGIALRGTTAYLAGETESTDFPVTEGAYRQFPLGGYSDGYVSALSVFISGDCNCDGLVNNFDIEAFVLALADPERYSSVYPRCDLSTADIDQDGRVNNFDIGPFVGLLIRY